MAHSSLVVALLVAVFGGASAACPSVRNAEDALSRVSPSVRFHNLDLSRLDYDGVEVLLMFDLDDPAPEEVVVREADVAVEVGGAPLVAVSGGGEVVRRPTPTALLVPVRVDYERVLAQLEAPPAEDSVDVGVRGAFVLETPVGVFEVDAEALALLPLLRPPTVSVHGLRLDQVDLAAGTARAVLDVALGYPVGGEPITIEAFGYEISLGGRAVSRGRLERVARLGAGETRRAALPIELRVADLGLAAFAALFEGAPWDLSLSAELVVGTPFGPVGLVLRDGARVRPSWDR